MDTNIYLILIKYPRKKWNFGTINKIDVFHSSILCIYIFFIEHKQLVVKYTYMPIAKVFYIFFTFSFYYFIQQMRLCTIFRFENTLFFFLSSHFQHAVTVISFTRVCAYSYDIKNQWCVMRQISW